MTTSLNLGFPANQNDPAASSSSTSLSVDQARQELQSFIYRFFGYAVPSYWAAHERYLACKKIGLPVRSPVVPICAATPTTGLGKSTAARQAAAQFIRNGGLGPDAAIVYFVPRHSLAEELALKFTAMTGIPAAIWRGADADDPLIPGETMCQQRDLLAAARAANVNLSAICKLCPSKTVCGYRRQRNQRAMVWFMPHQSLFIGKPAPIGTPKVVIIDEGFWQAGLVGDAQPHRLAVSALDAPLQGLSDEDAAYLERARQKLKLAISRIGVDGRLSLDGLRWVGIGEGMAGLAAKIEWQQKPSFCATGDLKALIAALERQIGLFDTRIPRLWSMIETCFKTRSPVVAGLQLRRQCRLRGGEGPADVLELGWRREVSPSWTEIPTLILDATARRELLAPYFGENLAFHEVAVASPYQRLTQVWDTGFSKNMFIGTGGTAAKKQARRNNVARLGKLITMKAFQYRDRSPGDFDVLFVGQKDVEAAIGQAPDRVALRHFNDIAGEDKYKDVACVIVAGRTLPNVRSLERLAEILTGRSVTAANSNRWETQARAVADSTGAEREIATPWHPDPVVEAARWSIAQGNILQALGRGRGINRGPAKPLEVILLTDLVLPLPITRLMRWRDIQVNRFQEAWMLSGGNMPVTDSELCRVFGPNGLSGVELWPSENAINKERRGKKGVKALLGSLIETSPPFAAEYRRADQRGPDSRALVSASDPAVAKTELEKIVGTVTEFRLVA